MITFAQAETLKKELTDRYVVVQEGVPELRRFHGKTGQVRTVNMSGRALVQFDGSEDIGWYDIDPTYLKIVPAPVKSASKAAKKENDAPVAEKKPAAKPTGKSPLEQARAQGASGAGKSAPVASGKKLSPLELARQQGAAGAAGHAPAAKTADAAPAAETPNKKLSPLEMARQQGAAGSAKTAPAEKKPAAEAPSAKPPATAGKKLSPLELARQQGAAGATSAAPKAEKTAPIESAPTEPVAEDAAEVTPSVATATGSGPVKTPGTTAEIIALARQQGPVK